jgi:hypothetical protein
VPFDDHRTWLPRSTAKSRHAVAKLISGPSRPRPGSVMLAGGSTRARSTGNWR